MILTKGRYKAIINDDNMVNVYRDDDLIDWPGPWSDQNGAIEWATANLDHLDANDADN